jgi:hypothetical protein
MQSKWQKRIVRKKQGGLLLFHFRIVLNEFHIGKTEPKVCTVWKDQGEFNKTSEFFQFPESEGEKTFW